LYDASDEFGIAWDDETLGIDWGRSDPVLSERDRANPPLNWSNIPSFS
jgi:dTDP-4-dehydrorhamnose 3,5-epimerase